MAHSHINFKNPNNGRVKNAPVGFSWTTLIFGFWPALLRGDFKWAGLQILTMIVVSLATSGTGTIVPIILFAFIYNKAYIENLIKSGYKVENIQSSLTLEQLSEKLEIQLPTIAEQSSEVIA